MTDLTDEAVKALLDGATPGPWRADGEPWNRVVWSSADNRVCFMAHSNGLDDARDIATSNLAAAAPDLARALLAARSELARLFRRAAEAIAADPAVKALVAEAEARGMERAANIAEADAKQLTEEALQWRADNMPFAAQFAEEQAKAGPRIAAAIRAAKATP